MARTISDNFETIALMLKGGGDAIIFFTNTSAERDRGFTDAFEEGALKADAFEEGALKADAFKEGAFKADAFEEGAFKEGAFTTALSSTFLESETG